MLWIDAMWYQIPINAIFNEDPWCKCFSNAAHAQDVWCAAHVDVNDLVKILNLKKDIHMQKLSLNW